MFYIRQIWEMQKAPPPGRWFRDPAYMSIMLAELTVTVAFMVFYFWIRGIRPDDVDQSVARSLHLIRFEQQVGLFQEVRWQEAFIGHATIMSAANQIYAWGHYPVMLATAIWLFFFKGPTRFRFARNVVAISAILGIASYYLLPTAPPRLMAAHGYDFGFVDTVFGAASDVDYFQPEPFVNDYAALPSFHFGWMALSAAVLWVNTRRLLVRALAVIMPVVMWWAVTVTGNHYFFDMVFGGVVVAAAWLVVAAFARAPLPRAFAALVGEPSAAFAEARARQGEGA
ncbi:MAG: phosphatase PAP2 family protein [Dehalococcoidia bacterium]